MDNYGNFGKISFYGIPKEKGGDSSKNDSKMEDCVAKVMAKGHSKESAIKICKVSLGFTKDSHADDSIDDDPGHTHCIHCQKELHRELDCQSPESCDSRNHLEIGHYLPANTPIEGQGVGARQMVSSATDKPAQTHPVCHPCNLDYEKAQTAMFSGDEKAASEGENFVRNFTHKDYRDRKHPHALIGQGKNSFPPPLQGDGYTPTGEDFKKNPDRPNATLGEMDNLTADKLVAVRDIQRDMISKGATQDDLRERFQKDQFYGSGKQQSRHNTKSSFVQRQYTMARMLLKSWGGTRDNISEKDEQLLQAKKDRQKQRKEGNMTDSINVEHDDISEAGRPGGAIDWIDHPGKLAPGINPATCERCGAPMELHNKWETNKQSNVESELETTQMVFEDLAAHLETEHDIQVPGRYASADDDLIIDYLQHEHKEAHEKMAQQNLNFDLLDLGSHPPEGDVGTWAEFQASGEPDINTWAREKVVEDHERADKASIKGEQANDDTFKLEDHDLDEDGKIDDSHLTAEASKRTAAVTDPISVTHRVSSIHEAAPDIPWRPVDEIGAMEPYRNRQRAGNCPFCKNPVDPDSFKDEISKKEFGISGLCQNCQDDFFKDPDEE